MTGGSRGQRTLRPAAPLAALCLLLVLAACSGTGSGAGTPSSRGSSASAGSSAPAPSAADDPRSGAMSAASSGSRAGTRPTSAPRTNPAATSSDRATSSRPGSSTSPPRTSTGWTGSHPLPAGVAPEASGLVRTTDGTFYTVDDATGTGELVALRPDGSLLARVRVAAMEASNAEALAYAPCSTGEADAGRCLFVGDIGDHTGRDAVTIYRVPEPTGPPWFAQATAWTYTYADGPHNAESMFVGSDGALVVITKSAPDDSGSVPPHRIYRGEPGGGVLRAVGSFTPPAPAVPLQSMITGTVVTDAFYDGHRLLLLTYDQVIQYTPTDPAADPAGFPAWPHRSLPMPDLTQAEGITGAADGCGYAVISEAGPLGGPARLAEMPCSR